MKVKVALAWEAEIEVSPGASESVIKNEAWQQFKADITPNFTKLVRIRSGETEKAFKAWKDYLKWKEDGGEDLDSYVCDPEDNSSPTKESYNALIEAMKKGLIQVNVYNGEGISFSEPVPTDELLEQMFPSEQETYFEQQYGEPDAVMTDQYIGRDS